MSPASVGLGLAVGEHSLDRVAIEPLYRAVPLWAPDAAGGSHALVISIDENRESHGVEPICAQLPIAPTTYYETKASEIPPARRSDPRETANSARRSSGSTVKTRAFTEHAGSGSNSSGTVARCTVERLMRKLALRGIVRGARVRTTIPDESSNRPGDLVERRLLPITASRPLNGTLWSAAAVVCRIHGFRTLRSFFPVSFG